MNFSKPAKVDIQRQLHRATLFHLLTPSRLTRVIINQPKQAAANAFDSGAAAARARSQYEKWLSTWLPTPLIVLARALRRRGALYTRQESKRRHRRRQEEEEKHQPARAQKTRAIFRAEVCAHV